MRFRILLNSSAAAAGLSRHPASLAVVVPDWSTCFDMGLLPRLGLMMCQNDLLNYQAVETAYVTSAKLMLLDLLKYEIRGPGDFGNALRRVAADRCGVPFSPLWRLHYGRCKTISPGLYVAILAAYEAICEDRTIDCTDYATPPVWLLPPPKKRSYITPA